MNTRILTLAAFISLVGASACQQEVKANVACKGQEGGINCTVTQTQGDQKVNVCWKIKATCKNGTVVTGSGCADVSGGGKTEHMIPSDKLENDDKCDASDVMSIEDLKITGA
jgi:hypothetical protein